MANYAVAKIGKSIKFNSSSWGSIGGDNEAPYFIYTMAKRYPNDTFWIIGKSDYSKVFKDKPLLPNIKDLWSNEYWDCDSNPGVWNKIIRTNDYDKGPEVFKAYYDYIEDTFKRLGITIDFTFIFYGMFFTCNLFHTVPMINSKDSFKYVKCLMSATNYAAPIIKWLNTYKGEYAGIVTDPRQFRVRPRDLVHHPDVYLSQINKLLSFTNANDSLYYSGDIPNVPKAVAEKPNHYAAVECMNILSKKPYVKLPKKTGFNIILNQGYPRKTPQELPPRFLELKKWILNDKNFSCSIYGKWDDDIMKSDTRFKGILHPNDLGIVLETTKYTLCIPIASGWLTAKFLEMAHYGVIPFVVPEYGSECGDTYIPKFLIVSSKEDLMKKIEYLENSDEAYQTIRKYLSNLLSSIYTGDFLLDHIRETVNKYTSYRLSEPVKNDIPIAELYENDIQQEKCLNNPNDFDNLF